MSGELSWYIARTGGFVAWALSAFSILWGLLITSRALGKRISGPRLLDLHRFIGGLSVVFVFIHITGLKLHRFEEIDFEFKELLIPMASDWHPGAVAYGIVAFYLLIAVEVTSLLRRRIPASIWRSIHYGGFVVFLLGSIHALKVGTDVQNPVIWWPSAVLCAAIVGLGVTRAMAAAQEASGKAPDIEIEIFDTPEPDTFAHVITSPPRDQFAAPNPRPVVAPAAPLPEPVAEALATTARVDDNRAALLERTRRSLERLDTTAYPRAELPPELLTTRPVLPPAADVEPDQAEPELPTRPVADIALRYARMRNPANPRGAVPPSFQSHIPPGANTQSNWGQPPAGWDGPSATPAIAPEPVAAPAAPVEVASTTPPANIEFTPFADLAPAADAAPVAEAPAPVVEAPAPIEAVAAPLAPADPDPDLFAPFAPASEPAAAVGLPDPQSRTAWQDQTRPVSSLDWRTPTRAPDNGRSPAVEPDRDEESEPSVGATRSGLPSRTPQRLARSTQPARNPLDWKPQRLAEAPMGGAPQPPTPDPETGDVPPEQYRAWLREWLAFAENYEG